MAVLDQQAVQIRERLQRCAWRTQGEGRARGCVQHPAGERDDNTMADLYVDEFTGCAALAIHAAQSSAVQRVPTVEDLNFLPDMGRMNRNWRWAGRTGCLLVACAGQRASALMSLLHTAWRNGHEPYTYLKDVLERLPTHPASALTDLLPYRCKPTV
jgi:hypothetical protein